MEQVPDTTDADIFRTFDGLLWRCFRYWSLLANSPDRDQLAALTTRLQHLPEISGNWMHSGNLHLGREIQKNRLTVANSRQALPQRTELQSKTTSSWHRQLWLQQYHRFNWLADVALLQEDQASTNKLSFLLGDWLAAFGCGQAFKHPVAVYRQVWSLPVICERQTAWLRYLPAMVFDPQPKLRQSLLDNWLALLIIQHRILKFAAERLQHPRSPISPFLLTALLLGDKYNLHKNKLTPAIVRQLIVKTIRSNFRDDGLPTSGNPQQLLALVVALADNYQLVGKTSSARLIKQSLSYLSQRLRYLQHRDGSTVVFHGGLECDSPSLKRLISKYAPRSAALTMAGILRLAVGKTTLFLDAVNFPEYRRCCASPLAIEFSSGKSRIVVNCGYPSQNLLNPESLRKYGVTAAHSSLVLNSTNSCEVHSSRNTPRRNARVLVSPPATSAIAAQCRQQYRLLTVGARNGTPAEFRPENIITASHNGYISNYRCGHLRRIAVAGNGTVIFGQDCLTGTAGYKFRLYFHLHPMIRAASSNNNSVLLKCSNRMIWRFFCDQQTGLQASVYWGSGGKQTTTAITVSGTTGAGETWINWAWQLFY